MGCLVEIPNYETNTLSVISSILVFEDDVLVKYYDNPLSVEAVFNYDCSKSKNYNIDKRKKLKFEITNYFIRFHSKTIFNKIDYLWREYEYECLLINESCIDKDRFIKIKESKFSPKNSIVNYVVVYWEVNESFVTFLSEFLKDNKILKELSQMFSRSGCDDFDDYLNKKVDYLLSLDLDSHLYYVKNEVGGEK